MITLFIIPAVLLILAASVTEGFTSVFVLGLGLLILAIGIAAWRIVSTVLDSVSKP